MHHYTVVYIHTVDILRHSSECVYVGGGGPEAVGNWDISLMRNCCGVLIKRPNVAIPNELAKAFLFLSPRHEAKCLSHLNNNKKKQHSVTEFGRELCKISVCIPLGVFVLYKGC